MPNSPGCSSGICCMTRTRRAAASCHAYTHAFQDRFFFELVERRGGYDQYGAPNAAVRMAAQARQQRK